MSHIQEYKKKQHDRQKERILYVMGDCCQLCGYNKCKQALNLHHIDPAEKDRGISGNLSRNSWKKIVIELRKCILVCANCHQEIHYGHTSKKLVSSLDETKACEIETEIELLKQKTQFFCVDCGQEISQNSLRCFSCHVKYRQTTPRPSRVELKKLIRTTPFTILGKQYGVSDNAIRKWCITEQLPHRKKDIVKFSDEEWEKI